MNKYFWNSAKWEVNTNGVGREIHPLVALAAAAMIGGLFVVFLPFIGLYLFVKHVIGMLANPVKDLFQTSVTPIAEPGMAHFTGSKSKKSAAAEETLEELSKEIQDRRQ